MHNFTLIVNLICCVAIHSPGGTLLGSALHLSWIILCSWLLTWILGHLLIPKSHKAVLWALYSLKGSDFSQRSLKWELELCNEYLKNWAIVSLFLFYQKMNRSLERSILLKEALLESQAPPKNVGKVRCASLKGPENDWKLEKVL